MLIFEHCHAIMDKLSPGPRPADWILEQISGQGRFTTEAMQQRVPNALLVHTANAAIAAWRALPFKGTVLTPISKVVQGPQEDFSEFVSRLFEAVRRMLGEEDLDKIVKQLAYENANSTTALC